MRILVHICCAPDAVYFLKRLREDYPKSEILGFFYDPNIHPYEEYRLRFIETKRVCGELGIKLYEGEYDLEGWLSAVKGYEDEPERGKRCGICFDYRLSRSLSFAKEVEATHLTTTLLMSPKKDFLMLKKSGEELCKGVGLEFLPLDYRKGGGTQEMFKLSKELEIYHQDYCGCVYGLFKQKGERAKGDLTSFIGRRPGSKEELLFIKEVRLMAEAELGLSCREWEFSFLNWRVLSGKIEASGSVIPSFVRPYSSSIKGLLKADPLEKVDETIYYNRGGLRVVLTNGLRDEPLERIDGLCEPTFLVPFDYEEVLLQNRVTATLQTEITQDKSLILLVGSLDAEEIRYIPADTLQDGRGISLPWTWEILRRERNEILRGRKAFLLVGASSLGNPGLAYFEKRTGRKVSPLLCNQTS
ncbi:MAG: epoxyqueuosine reductase QueH [Aquificaceae bacterium]|nr:epoxyqueuosine reductase QueH [Aquificaceae bacterium]